MYNLQTLFLLFIFYSIIGWIVESIYVSALQKKIVNRGFLLGPYCPVYGTGCVFITLLLDSIQNTLFLFFAAVVICGLVEYITSFLLEKIFHARWWDYSDKKFNIKGRVCLENMVLFGLAGVVVIMGLNPIFFSLINHISHLNTISVVIAFLFILDLSFSLAVISHIRHDSTMQIKDSTNEISKEVRTKAGKVTIGALNKTSKTVKQLYSYIDTFRGELSKKVTKNLYKKSFVYKRLINAYPDFKIHFTNKIKDKIISKIK